MESLLASAIPAPSASSFDRFVEMKERESFATRAKTFLPSTKSHLLSLRKDKTSTHTTNPDSIAAILKGYWESVWAEDEIPDQVFEEGLRHYDKSIHKAPPRPTVKLFRKIILGTSNSSPGPDGVPFSFIRQFVDLFAPLLFGATLVMMSGIPPPRGFNFALGFFLPKKLTGLVEDTRPISVPDTVNRVIAKVMVTLLLPPIAKLVEERQSCGIPDKRIHSNVASLASSYYASLGKKEIAFILFVDFTKAFDSIPHGWIAKVLVKVGFPAWVVAIVKGLLSNLVLIPSMSRKLASFISIFKGVKQGCPLSPLLFILIIDPTLVKIRMAGSHPWAYCDDIAVKVLSLSQLEKILDAIISMSAPTNLHVNPIKTRVLPTSEGNESNWTHTTGLTLSYVHAYKYLGFWIGSNVKTSFVFKEALEKMEARAESYHTIKNSLTVQQRILIANIFLFPILYYLASLYLLSSTLVSKANDIIGRFVVSGKFFKVEHLTRPSALVGFKTPLTDLHLKNLSLILSDTTFPLDQKPSNDKLHPLHPHTHFVRAYDPAFRRKPRIAGLPIEQEIHTASRLYRALLFASLTRRHHVTQLEDRIKALFGVALQLEKPGHAVTMANRLVINSTSLPPSTPGPLRTHLFHLIHSSLPTDRRTRHSRGVALEDVEPCAFCLQDQDSVPHLFGYCPVTLSAWVLSQKTIPDIPHIAHPLSLPLMLLLDPPRARPSDFCSPVQCCCLES